jgi:hypothetical protein
VNWPVAGNSPGCACRGYPRIEEGRTVARSICPVARVRAQSGQWMTLHGAPLLREGERRVAVRASVSYLALAVERMCVLPAVPVHDLVERPTVGSSERP